MEKTSNLVSVIIPTRNEEVNIKSCLESIKEQNYSTEIIVVDNFSTDKTVRIAKRYTEKVYQKGPERSAQRNFGARKAKGAYLLFLDADMRLTKNIILEAVTKAKKGNFIVALPEKAVGKNFWEKSIALERNIHIRQKLLDAARFYPRELFLKLKGFNEKLIAGEDWDLSIRAEKLGYNLVLTQRTIIHVEKVESLTDFLAKKSYYVKNITYYKNLHPKEFSEQSSLKARISIYLKNWGKLLADPVHTLGFIFLKILVWYIWRKNG